MSKENDRYKHWAKKAAALLIQKLPAEYIQCIIDNKDDDLKIVGEERVIKANDCELIKSMSKAENEATKILNQFYTQLIREELINQQLLLQHNQ